MCHVHRHRCYTSIVQFQFVSTSDFYWVEEYETRTTIAPPHLIWSLECFVIVVLITCLQNLGIVYYLNRLYAIAIRYEPYTNQWEDKEKPKPNRIKLVFEFIWSNAADRFWLSSRPIALTMKIAVVLLFVSIVYTRWRMRCKKINNNWIYEPRHDHFPLLFTPIRLWAQSILRLRACAHHVEIKKQFSDFVFDLS